MWQRELVAFDCSEYIDDHTTFTHCTKYEAESRLASGGNVNTHARNDKNYTLKSLRPLEKTHTQKLLPLPLPLDDPVSRCHTKLSGICTFLQVTKQEPRAYGPRGLEDEEQPQVVRPPLHCGWKPHGALILLTGIPTSSFNCVCSKPLFGFRRH